MSKNIYESREQHIPAGELEAKQWTAMKDGDRSALKHLYHYYKGDLYNYCHKFTSDEDIIKDCIQELFIYLWEKRGAIVVPTKPRNYIFRSIRNNLLRRLGAADKNTSMDNPESYPFLVTLDAESEMVNEERQERIAIRLSKALDRLTNRQREAIYLRFYENLSFDDIADTLGITTKASYKLLYRAIDILRAELPKKLIDLLMIVFYQPKIQG